MNARIVLMCVFAVAAAGCGGGSGGGPSLPSHFLYAVVSSTDSAGTLSGGIYAYGIDDSGALIPVSGSPFAATSGNAPAAIAITPDSKFLYSLDSIMFNLSAFQIHSDGSLTAVSGAPVATTNYPQALVASPNFVYVVGIDDNLMVFAIDSATGAVSLKSSTMVCSDGQCTTNAAAITPDGRDLYLGLSPPGLQVGGFTTNAATGAPSAVPGSPVSATDGYYPGDIAIDPAGKFLYVSDDVALQLHIGGVYAYAIDAVSGALTVVPGSPFAVGGTPTSVAIDASGRFLITDIGPPGNCLAVLSIDPGTGALALVPGSPFGQICGSVAADPAGPYVYIGESYSSNSNTGGGLFVFSVNEATGALTQIGGEAFPGRSVSRIVLTH